MMEDLVAVNGVVLQVMPIGESEKRVELLTRERGRISAFARGMKKPNNPLKAIASPFVCGKFFLREHGNSATLESGEIIDYFTSLAFDPESFCYASYFTEWARYYSRENLPGSDMLNLLYLSFRALEKGALDKVLIRYVFELRIMMIEGEYTQQPPMVVGDSARYAWQYVLTAPIGKVFSFNLTEPALTEFGQAVTRLRMRVVDRAFKSLDILESMKDFHI